ncbi:MAG: DUF559 domain-containing protein [Propionibacteriales bacterium]|nr:DUF559 domain-containing protein [Propionibacteriales bacterium]
MTWHSVDRWRFSGPVAPVGDAVRQVIACHDPELALIVLESALNLGLIGWAEAEHLTRRASRRKAAVLAHLSEQAQSGGETRVRLFLELHGVHVRAQVSIPGVGRVDLLVGDRLVIECDSRQHHTGGKHYARDRRRDLELITLGYKPVRLTYHQIFFEWEATQQYLLRLVRSGRRRVRLVAA